MCFKNSRLKEDIKKYYKIAEAPTMGLRIFNLWRTPGIYAVITYRFRNWLSRKNKCIRYSLLPINLYLQHRMRSKWGIEISENADIGGGFIVMHQGGIFIGPKGLVAGKNLTVHQNVTIGLTYGNKRRGAPTIGDNVIIGPGAKVLGKITIGDNVKIGPNAVVLKNVPDNAVVSVLEPRVVIFPVDLDKVPTTPNSKSISTKEK